MSKSSIWFGLCITASAFFAVPAQASVMWNHAFMFETSNGLTNPGVLVGFNPQPEPPAGVITQLDNSDPSEPMLTVPGQSTGTFFDLFIAMGLPAVQLQLVPDAIPSDTVDTLHLQAMAMGQAGVMMNLFDVYFDFQSTSGGVMDGATAVAFNPQPEPPGFGADSDFGVNFTFTSFSDVSVGLRVVDTQGNQLNLKRVPEPATLTTFALGLAGLGFVRRRRSA